ncbi:hypothetical protein [Thalassotalea aquiviva]|uniref:hypothetical protein n=1 Tax=Thalassotalea aquiviva TaxID=3242415 RepID=UPI00352B06E5
MIVSLNIRALLTMLFLFIFLAPLMGCAKSANTMDTSAGKTMATKHESLPMKHPTEVPESLSRKPKEQFQWYTGTIKFINLEGGFYGLMSNTGEKFLLLNLAKEFQQDGAKVKILGRVDNSIMTIYQWGVPFRVKHVEVLVPGVKVTPSEI